MRKQFREDENFAIGQSVEWRNGSHWRAGTVISEHKTDTLGYPYYPVRDTAPSTRTVTMGTVVYGYPGYIRA